MVQFWIFQNTLKSGHEESAFFGESFMPIFSQNGVQNLPFQHFYKTPESDFPLVFGRFFR